MKKGILVFLGVLVFSLVIGSAFASEKNSEAKFYKGIMLVNEYGEFYFSFPFVIDGIGRAFTLNPRSYNYSIKFRAVPGSVGYVRNKENESYDYWHMSITHYYSCSRGMEIYFVDSEENRTPVDYLRISIDAQLDIQELEQWQKLIMLAHKVRPKASVYIQGEVLGLSYCGSGEYTLTIKINDVIL